MPALTNHTALPPSPLDKIRNLLAEAKSLEDLTTIRDQAELLRKCLQSAQASLETQNQAAELKLRAERQAGTALAKLKLRGGSRRTNTHHDRLSLAELGISQNDSTRWQREAAVPDTVFESFLEHKKQAGREITSAALLRLARSLLPTKAPGRPSNSSTATELANHRQAVPLSAAGCERLEELSSHFKLLAELVAPLCESSPESRKRTTVEMRAVKRYLRQSESVLEELLQEVRKAAAHPPR